MLKVKNVHKSFGENEILKGVDLTVEKGDVVVIIGPSGSGKTTFLRCLDFLETADKGEMEFDEIHTDLSHPHKKNVLQVRRKTGFVFQNYNLFTNKTALENVMEGLVTARKIPKEDAKKNCGRSSFKSRTFGTQGFLSVAAFWRTTAACRNCARHCNES